MLTERAEDYPGAIYTVHGKKGYVRVKDVARALSVKSPSVTEMLKSWSRPSKTTKNQWP